MSSYAGETASTEETSRSRKRVRVTLMHSETHTNVLYGAMQYIHHDRDVLLAALLDYCGFLKKPPRFFRVVSPKRATRQQLECFHAPHYLDMLECHYDGTDQEGLKPLPSLQLLDSMGLTDDCPLPSHPIARADLWTYCRQVAGASLQAAHLLASDRTDVAIHWGGGRHHAHAALAGGFCYVNDVVLALQYLRRHCKRTLYLDIDIHHCDGVQRAFYDTDRVMTVSYHRHAAGFFPYPTGSVGEKGRYQTSGVGHNLNLPLPSGVTDADFVRLFRYVLTNLVETYDPQAVGLCVGADGLRGDPLVTSSDFGWNLTPEGLAECVRLTADHCASTDRKLLVLGAGGYHPAATARTFLLGTAAACEGARPGMLWTELPKDVPPHEHFGRYGPDFRLVDDQGLVEELDDSLVTTRFPEAIQAVDLSILYLQAQQRESVMDYASPPHVDEENWWTSTIPSKVHPNRSVNSGGGVRSSVGSSKLENTKNQQFRRRRQKKCGHKLQEH